MKKARKSKGFTLAELLIVVAIIGILLAVAIPNVLSYYRSMKLTELDDSARTIFMAAQNRLTAMKNAGKDLNKLSDIDVKENLSSGIGAGKYIAVTSGQLGLASLVPGGSIEAQLHDNHYVVEIDPKNGAVYAVWYWEEEDFDYKDAYNSVKPDKDKRLDAGQMVGYYGGAFIDRLTIGQTPLPSAQIINAEELKLEITIPGGSGSSAPAINATVTLSDSSGHKVTIIKEAKLVYDSGPANCYSGTIVLDTLDESKYDGEGTTNFTSGKPKGMKFKNWKDVDTSKTDTITPGANFDIEITVTAVDSGADPVNYLPQYIYLSDVNSLFAGLEEIKGTAGEGTGKYTALIAYGRHLQNLHDSGTYSGTGEYCSGVLANTSITKARQIGDINFTLTNADEPIKSWASTYGTLDFHPVNNPQLIEYDGGNFEIRNMNAGHYRYGGVFSYIKGGTYKNIVIVNPHIHAEGEVTDVEVNPAGGQPLTAGALAGVVDGNVTIENCRVYNECVPDKDDGTNVAKLFDLSFDLDDLMMYYDGTAIKPGDPGWDKVVENLYVKRLQGLPHIGAPASGSNSGGLVGEVLSTGSVTITDSFASVINIGAKNVGGLVGVSGGNLTIESSYSASYVFGNRNVAGLVGCVEDTSKTTTITNSYAAGEIVSGYVKGFKGAGLLHYASEEKATKTPDTIKVTDCYAAVRYDGDGVDGLPRGDDYLAGLTTQSVVGFIYGTFKGDSANLYIPQNGISYGFDSPTTTRVTSGEKYDDKGLQSENGKSSNASELTTELTTGWTTGGATEPYRLLKDLKDENSLTIPYPYPMLNVEKDGITTTQPHYGDWLENKANGSLVNWEQYPASAGTTEYGFWGLLGHGGVVQTINNLKRGDLRNNDLEYAVADGYGVLVAQDASGNSTAPEVFIGTNITKETLTKIENAYTDGSVKYDLYKIPYTAPVDAPAAYYTAVTVNGSTFWYNPDFACEVFERREGDTAPAEPQEKQDAEGDPTGVASSTTKGVVIRTARQFANLPVYTGPTLNDKNHAQLRAYTQMLDIDYEKYDGTIKGKSSTDFQSPAALTKTESNSEYGSYNGNNFVIKNLFINGGSNVGLFGQLYLADKTTGVRNVFLVDVTVTGTGDNVGALVGSASGSTVIDHCGVYVSPEKYTTCTVTGQQTVGGLIGMVGSSTTVQNSFAAVQVSGTTYVGGFAGQINGNRELANCYSGGYTRDGQYKADTANVTATDITNGIAGGFAGRMINYNNTDDKPTSLKLSGVLYSTCSAKGHTVGLLIGQFNEKNGTASSGEEYQSFRDKFSDPAAGLTLYATGMAFNNAGDPMTSGLNEETYLTIGNAIPRGTLTAADTHNYDTPTLDNAAYPYATNLTEHHGDWVTYPMLANIEKYQKGTDDPIYGAYAASVDAGGKVNVAFNSLMSQDALTDAGMDLVNDYYRIISPQELTTLAFTLDSTSGNLVSDTANFTGGKVKLGTETYYVYKFETTDWDSVTNYYHTLTNGNYTFLFNSRFGLEAFDVMAKPDTPQNAILEKPEAAGKDASGKAVEVEYIDAAGNSIDNPTGVVIRSARQLANMQAYANDSTTGTTAQGWTYDQLLDVNFTKYNDNVPGKTAPGLAPAALTNGAYDGHGNLIVNLYIGPGAATTNLAGGTDYAPAGLFGTVTGGEVRHVRLVNIDLDLSNGSAGADSVAIGGLIGRLENGTVNDCGIYVDEKLAETFVTSLVNLYTSKKVAGSGENGVGGLIGQIQHGTVSNSFAAVKVEGTGVAAAPAINPVGGFVGQMNGGTIENCYVGGYVDAASKTYVADTVNVSGNNVGGFVGSIAVSGINFNGINYSTASVYGPDPDRLGLFAGAGKANVGTGADDAIYALAKAFTDETDAAGTTKKVVTAARDESAYLSNPEIVRKTNATLDEHFDAFHYNRGTDVYPYQTATDQTEHHGDWIGLTKGVYYDTVGTATGYYTNGDNMSGAALASRPAGGVAYATDGGYMFLSETDLGDVALGINGASFMLEQKKDAAGNPDKEIIGTTEYYVYCVPADALNTMPVDAYYFTVSVNGQLFTANFAFAGEIFDYGTVTNMKTPMKKTLLTEGAAIRTPRQLANAGIWTSRSEASGAIARGLKYEQLLDIDYDEYIKISDTKMPKIYKENKDNNHAPIEYNHVPITLGAGASFNGNECTIRGLLPGYLLDKDSSGTFALNGLFGRVKDANISNVNLINARVVGYADNKAVAQLDETGGTSTSSLPLGGEPMTTASGDVMEAGNTYTLETKNMSEQTISADYACGTNNLFTLIYKSGKTVKIEKRDAKYDWTDGYSVAKGSKWLSFSGKVDLDACAVKFTVAGPATVKVWWICTSNGRQAKVIDASGNNIAPVSTQTTTNDKPYCYEFKLESGGTYYLGSNEGAIRIYKVEVIVNGGGTVTPPGPGPTKPTGENGVNETLLAKGILAPMGHGIEISTSAKVRVGALAGILDGATVTDSGAYVEATKTETDPAHDTADKAYNYYIVKNEIAGSEDAVGGFAGNVADSNVHSSFSAVKVIGVNFVGGFAGKLGGSGTTTVENCYSGGHTYNGSYYGADGKAMTNVEATDGANTGVGGFAGFVSKSGTVTFKGVNYTTSSVGLKNSAAVSKVQKPISNTAANDPQVNYVETGTTIGAFFGRVEYVKDHTNIVTTDAINYATGTLFSNGSAIKRNATVSTVNGYRWDTDKWIEATSEKKASVQYVTADEKYINDLVTMLDPREGVEDQHYDNSLGNTYPYMAAKAADGTTELVHHGDWTNRLDFIYYEVYDRSVNIDENTPETDIADYIKNEKIGFYGVLRGQASPINTLEKDGVVYDSGYMVVNNYGNVGPVDIQLRTEYTKEGENNTNHYNQAILMESKDVTSAGLTWANYVYIVPFSVLNIAPSDHYYMLAYVNGVTYVFNPHFAGEAINVDLIKDGDVKSNTIDLDTVREKKGLLNNGSDTDDVVIRSAWNFSSLARYCRPSNNGKTSELIRTKNIIQEMNLDYSESTGYRVGKVYDGNDNNRYREGDKGTYDYKSGSGHLYGHAPTILSTGSYDGQGHFIHNIYLSNDSGKGNNYAGLFVIDGSGTVRNLSLENIHVNAGKLAAGTSGSISAGGIAAYINGGTLEGVDIKNVEFDFHTIPTYNDDDDKWEYSTAKIPLTSVGGAVGLLQKGTVKDVTVDGVKMIFDGSITHYYTGKANYSANKGEATSASASDVVTKNANGSKAPSNIGDTQNISIGGAIGEINVASGAGVSVTGVEVKEPDIKANKGKTLMVGGAIGNIDTSESTGGKATIDKVYVTDAIVNASVGEKNYVGGVIGRADGKAETATYDETKRGMIQISDSGVYLTNAVETDGTDNFNETYVVLDKSTGDFVGGFVGRTDNYVTVKNCFSAIRVEGAGSVGGFAGHIEGSVIEDCYSGGHTEGGAYGTVANVKGTGNVGGFAGKIEGSSSTLVLKGTIYTTSSVSGTGKVGLFQCGEENRDAVAKATKDGGATLYATGTVIGTGTALDESDYLSTSTKILWPEGKVPTGFTTSPYDDTLKGDDFPFKTNLMEHHGDWVEIPVASSLCYYEEYDGVDEYGVWGYLGPTKDPVNTNLKVGESGGDLDYALSDGYGVLVKKGELVPEHVTVDGKTFNLDTTTPLAKDEDIDGEQYDLYKIDTTGITSSTYYNKITVDKTDYWFNPFFACEVQTTEPADMNKPGAKKGAAGEDDTGTYDGKVVIRTARQLAEMAKQTGSEGIETPTTDEEKTKQAAQLRDYVQLLDIDFFESGITYTPAALWRTKDSSNKVTASGSYDGNEFSISNLNITGTENNVGLFGVLGTGGHEKDSTVVGDTDSGLIQNITLIDITVKGDGKNRVGALAGDVKNSTIIRNCGVYASNAEAYENCTITGKDYVGGLIGQVGSSTIIKNCFAAVKVTGENYVGGFAGQINGSKGMENCYSGGHTNGGEYTEANVTATSGSAGSFVGKLMNYQNDKDGTPDKPNDFVFSGVLYSTCSVSGKADKTGLFAGEVADWTEIPASNKNNSGEKGTAIKPVLEDITVYSTGVALVGTARAEDYLKDLNKVWDESENNLTAHPYDTDNLAEDGFHYESGFDDHYGDWVEPSTPAVQAAGIAYVEVYGSGEIGLQIVGYVKNGSVVVEINDRNVIDTLNYGKDAPLSTVSTYYVTFTTDDSTCSVDELGFVAGSEDDDGDITSAIINAFMETSDLTKGDLSTLKATLYDTTDVAIEGASENAAVNIDGDSKTLYYTVGLAGVSYDTFGEEDNPFRIRTAQQLDNIPDNVENDTYFRQTHDISGEEGYYGAAEFAGHFDGRGYRIQDLTSGATQDTCTGLFKSLSTGAEISNVVLYTKGSQMSGDNALTIDTNDPELLSFGGIANTASGTVSLTNCAVVGYDTTFDLSDDDVTEFYYGGLIGEVASDSTTTITNCAAINDVTLDVGTERNNQLGYYHGGLVGKIAGSLILKNCYTGGTDTIAGMGGGGLGSTTLADKAGAFGLTGKIDGGSVTANYCYSWVKDAVNNSKISVAPLGADEFTDSDHNYRLSATTSATTDATRKTYDQFLANNGDPLLTGSTTTDFGEAASSHPIGSSTYDDFPFPEVLQEIDENGDPTGTFVHYGDWPSDATSGPEFGLFLIYGDHPNAYSDGGNSDAYAVAVMFDKNGPSSYEQSRRGTTVAGIPNLTYYWGFAIRNANNSKLQAIKDNLTVEFYNTYVEGKTNTPTHTFTFNDAETKANDKFNNDSDFNGYLRFISKDTNKLTEADLAALAGTSSRIIVKYGDTEIASFNWSKLVPNPTKTSDPGIPEGPSFEVAMAPAVTEAIVPEKFKLPESEDIDENDDDGHTQIVDRRMSVARVRRVR